MSEPKRPTRAEKRRAKIAAERADAAAWQAKADAHFGYLRTTYGFRITQADASSFWQWSVLYQTDITAIEILRSVEFNRVEIKLIRLVDGALPEVPIFVTQDAVLNSFLFDNLLITRAPDVHAQYRTMTGLEDAQIEQSLAFLATALEQYASDVLQGDLTAAFAAMEQVVKQRAKENPPVITVHIPEDAPPDEEERVMAEHEGQFPGVPVVVRRYRRPAKRATRQPEDSQ